MVGILEENRNGTDHDGYGGAVPGSSFTDDGAIDSDTGIESNIKTDFETNAQKHNEHDLQ
jgi:hypothetical protein